jgi:cell division protein FtsB
MRKNRKREPLRFGVVTRSLLVCLVTAGIGVAYVWQKNQVYRLGDEVKKREVALLAAEKRNTMLAAQLAQLKSPGQLDARCQQYGLGLVAPKESQTIRLLEPGPEWDNRFLPAVQPATHSKPAPAKRPAASTRQVVSR